MRLSIELPDELHRELKVRAAREGKTISQVVRPLIEQYASTVEVRTTPVKGKGATTVRPISKADQARGKTRG